MHSCSPSRLSFHFSMCVSGFQENNSKKMKFPAYVGDINEGGGLKIGSEGGNLPPFLRRLTGMREMSSQSVVMPWHKTHCRWCSLSNDVRGQFALRRNGRRPGKRSSTYQSSTPLRTNVCTITTEVPSPRSTKATPSFTLYVLFLLVVKVRFTYIHTLSP